MYYLVALQHKPPQETYLQNVLFVVILYLDNAGVKLKIQNDIGIRNKTADDKLLKIGTSRWCGMQHEHTFVFNAFGLNQKEGVLDFQKVYKN